MWWDGTPVAGRAVITYVGSRPRRPASGVLADHVPYAAADGGGTPRHADPETPLAERRVEYHVRRQEELFNREEPRACSVLTSRCCAAPRCRRRRAAGDQLEQHPSSSPAAYPTCGWCRSTRATTRAGRATSRCWVRRRRGVLIASSCCGEPELIVPVRATSEARGARPVTGGHLDLLRQVPRASSNETGGAPEARPRPPSELLEAGLVELVVLRGRADE